MQAKRASLRKTIRPVSIIIKKASFEDIDDPFVQPSSSSNITPPLNPNLTLKPFTMAFDSLWSSLLNYSRSFLLEEGIQRAKSSRGFWLVSFPSIDTLIETWRSGSPMNLEYIGGGYEVAKYHSGGDEEFMNTVASYDLITTVCFIMVVDLMTSLATSWGTIDKNGGVNTSYGKGKI